MLKDVIPPTVAQALASGNKVEAIKRLRGITGLGLKEAKEWIDSYERGQAAPVREFDKPVGRDPNAPFTLPPQAIEALKRGSPLEAIKLIREVTGAGLAEAKGIVDAIKSQVPTGLRPPAGKSVADTSPYARPGLGPGEVPSSGGPGKWFVLIAVGALAILAAMYY